MHDLDIANAALVVAHPDDEILWFSSIIRQVKRTFVCFTDYAPLPQFGDRRRAALASFPLAGVQALDLEEPLSFLKADWPEPKLGPHGYVIRGSGPVASAYRQRFDDLTRALERQLKGYPAVFTHNAWGEYGHEDHGLVHAAVRAVRDRLGFELYFSCYVSQRNLALFNAVAPSLDASYLARPTDPQLAEQAATLYRAHGCWTWFDDYRWPAQEAFFHYRAADAAPPKAACLPLNFVYVDLPVQRPRRNVLQVASDKLKRRIRRRFGGTKAERAGSKK